MIGSIRGTLTQVQPPWLLVEVGGIGYELQAPMTTIYRLPPLRSEVQLAVHHLVREDAQQLFGFGSEAERALFRALIKVTGIGARIALAILSGMEAGDFARCVLDGDANRLTRLPGVGRKTADRLIVEMRDRMADWHAGAAPAQPAAAGAGAPASDPVADAISGLIGLGYKPAEASRYVHAVDSAGRSADAIIREALRALVKA